MATVAHAVLDVETRNARIRNVGENPNGEIESILNPSEKLSYDRWCFSVIYRRGISQAIALNWREDHGGALNYANDLLWKFVSYASILFEKTSPLRGYELIQIDLGPYKHNRNYAEIGIYTNSEQSLADIADSTGAVFRSAAVIGDLLQFANDKRTQCDACLLALARGEEPENPVRFNAFNPDPAADIYNCITFAFEIARPVVNLYPRNAIIPLTPRMHIRPAQEILTEAFAHPDPTDGAMLDRLSAYTKEELVNQMNMHRTIISMYVLGVYGPFVFREYKRLLTEREIDPLFMGLEVHEVVKVAKANTEKTLGKAFIGSLVSLITCLPTVAAVTVAESVAKGVDCVAVPRAKKKAVSRFLAGE